MFSRLSASPQSHLSLLLLVLANLVPLVMVFLADWSVGELLMVFWLENVVIGIYNVLRMISCGQRHAGYSKPFIIPFFIVHYGMFTLGHGAILHSLFLENSGMAEPPFGPQMVLLVVHQLNLWWPLAALVVSHGFSFIWHYLIRGEYRDAKLGELMARPYGRVIVLHIAVLLGGLAAQALGSPIWALVVLLSLKIFLDGAAHLKMHAQPTLPK